MPSQFLHFRNISFLWPRRRVNACNSHGFINASFSNNTCAWSDTAKLQSFQSDNDVAPYQIDMDDAICNRNIYRSNNRRSVSHCYSKALTTGNYRHFHTVLLMGSQYESYYILVGDVHRHRLVCIFRNNVRRRNWTVSSPIYKSNN